MTKVRRGNYIFMTWLSNHGPALPADSAADPEIGGRGPAVKIQKVSHNNRRKVFEVTTRTGTSTFPYAIADPKPSTKDRIVSLFVDEELGREGFTYVLQSGKEGSVLLDHVLHFNRDPGYLTDMLLYHLTLEAQRQIERSSLGTRELIRRLGTSSAQYYRLIDQTNYRKSVRQMLSLLHLFDCEVELVIRDRKSA